MINYRYNILEKLGEGGSGEVFLAEDARRKNLRVAIKILHAVEKSGTDADEAFHNEVSALVNLSHPNLVRIFDFGSIRHAEPSSLQQRRFFTMEFIRGADSLEWVSSLKSQQDKESLLELLLLQSLSVLSYVHHEGVIHFDIKPQNFVLVGDRGTAATPLLKLTDFGFSKKTDDSLDIPIRGTLEYTAPELLKGEQYDHRLDLYSLGATFYHLLEGHCPFEAKEPVELAKRVLTEDVVFSTKAANSESRLREVIGSLMQKDTARRFATAEEAARTLVADNPKGKEIFESYFGLLRKSRFVGRRNELKIIEDAISFLTQKDGPWEQSAIVVSGVEGIGKTTLLKESLKCARAQELPVFEIESIQSDVPFGSVATVLDLMASDVRSFSEKGKHVFTKYDELIGFSREESARFEVWGRQKENVVELMSRFIIECAEIFPFIIFADNLQLLDESSVNVLRTSVRDVRPRQLLLLAAETSEIAKVISPPMARELGLHELASEEISEMSASVLGVGSVANEIGSNIYNLYGGTPGIVVEALNAVSVLVPSEALRDESIARKYIDSLESKLPQNIDDFLLARYQKLSRERQLILSMLSCFQYHAKTTVLVQLLPFHRARSADHIRFLQLDGFIGMTENERLLFIRMKRLKDVVYATIKGERNELHALIASTLEHDADVSEFTQLQELAFQHLQCNAFEKASAYYEKAADEGIKLFALQRALQLYREAMGAAKLSREVERECALEVKFASALFKAGSYREAIDLGKELTRRQQLDSLQKSALFKAMGLSLSRLGENEQAEEHINIVLQLSTNEVERLELRQELVGLQISAGRFKQAEKECLEQLVYAKELENDRLVGAIYTDLGITAFFQDKFDYAVQCFSDAMKTYEELNEKTQVINSINNIGNAQSAKGDFMQAIAYWEKALKACQEFGTLNQQAQIQNNLGIAPYNLKK
ncbi:MAG: protein kinase [Bacteroidota bacterium]